MPIASFVRSRTFPILLVNFLGILGYSLVLPILIFIVSDFGGNGFIYGLIGATYPLFQFIGAPKLGKLSDRIGRKKVLIITQLGSFLAWSLFLLAFFVPKITIWSQQVSIVGGYVVTLPLLLLFIARMIDGYTGGNISVANAYMADISTDADRNKNFGLIGTSTSLGLAVGPAISALLAATFLEELLPLMIATAAALLTAIIINKKLTESNPCIENTVVPSIKEFGQFFQVVPKNCYDENNMESGSVAKNGWREILSIKGIPVMYFIYFLTYLAFNLFYVALPIYASTELNWTAAELGIFLAYFSLMMMVTQGPVLTKVSRYADSATLMIAGAVFLSIGFVLLLGKNVTLLYAAVTLMALGNGIMWPSFLAMLSQMGSPSKRGAIQGYGASMGSIAGMVGLILGGFFFEFWGTAIFKISAGIFLVVAFTVLFRLPYVKLRIKKYFFECNKFRLLSIKRKF